MPMHRCLGVRSLGPRSVGLGAVLLGLAVSVGAAAAAPPLPPGAKAVDQAAYALYQRKALPEAAAVYERGYATLRVPAFLYNAGFIWLEAGDRAQALGLFERYVASEGPLAKRADAQRRIRKLTRALRRTHAPLAITAPVDARVTVNGAPVALPYRRWLPPGSVTVAATRPGAAPWRQVVVLRPGQPATVTVTLRAALGRLEVTSVPPGARVHLDGRPVGLAPLTLSDLAPGTHRLRLELPGHRPSERRVEVVVGGVARVTLRLVPATAARTAPGPEPAPPTPPRPPRSIATKWWFWTIIGAVVAGGVTAGVVLGLPKEPGQRSAPGASWGVYQPGGAP